MTNSQNEESSSLRAYDGSIFAPLPIDLGINFLFSRNHPPLLKDYGLGVLVEAPADKLTYKFPAASYFQDFAIYNSNDRRIHCDYVLVRELNWFMADNPQHLVADLAISLTWVEGFTDTQRTTFSEAMGVNFSGASLGLPIGVSDSLNITEETTRVWTRTETKKVDTTLKGGSSYCTWLLRDSLIGTKSVYDYNFRNSGNDRSPTSTQDFRVDCVLASYQDSCLNSELPTD